MIISGRFLLFISKNPVIISHDLHTEIKSSVLGTIHGTLFFKDEYILEFLELLRMEGGTITRPKYRFHFQRKGDIVFRYDNSPHFPGLDNFPHHKHLKDSVEPSRETSIFEVIMEIERSIK